MSEQQSPEQLAAAIVANLREAQRLTAQLRAQRRHGKPTKFWQAGTSIDHTAPLASHIKESIGALQSLFGGRL